MKDEITVACRSCGKKNLKLILSLGLMPLANSLRTAEELEQPEPRYPLDLAFCPECALVQIVDTVPPEKLFREYLYFSSFSTTMLQHAKEIATELVGERKLNDRSLVIEVASNDGYLLQYFKEARVPVLGIEPARNVAEVAIKEKGIPTVSEFFSEALAKQLVGEGKMADCILANNVLAHVENLNDFVRSLKLILKPDGVAVIEVPYVKDMIERCEFDTIYHEHVFYFSVTAVQHLLKQHGMALVRAERIPIHGGSLRLRVMHAGHRAEPSVEKLMNEEKELGMDQLDYYQTFSSQTQNVKKGLLTMISSLKADGKRLAAYGAAAKGAILLNFCGLNGEILDFVVDRNTHKQGRYMPGMRLPISSPGRLLEEMPDYTLLLPWNFADEILDQQSQYRDKGGRFIIPIPEARVV